MNQAKSSETWKLLKTFLPDELQINAVVVIRSVAANRSSPLTSMFPYRSDQKNNCRQSTHGYDATLDLMTPTCPRSHEIILYPGPA